MKKREYLLHLIGGISSFILDKNPSRMVISLHQEEDGVHICVIDNNEYEKDEIIKIEKALNSEKRPELASYYGAMTGHDFLGTSRLNLLGWQVKHCDVIKINSGLKIDIWIGGDKFDSRNFTIPNKEE